MRAAILLLGLLAPVEGIGAQQGAYEAVLRSLREEMGGMEVYLTNRPVGHFRHAPPSAAGDSLMHDPVWLAEMERDGIISGSCTPPKHSLDCTPPEPMSRRAHFSASFWPPTRTGGDSVRIGLTLSLPPLRPGVANVEKREYVVRHTADCSWEVVSHEVTGVS